MKFAEGEKVLCCAPVGSLIYEAKVLNIETTNNNEVKYLIHYSGWNKNWDEWVPENRLLKYNAENVQRQKEVHTVHSTGSEKNKKGAVATIVSTGKPNKLDCTISSAKDSDSTASTPSTTNDTTKIATAASATAGCKLRDRSLKSTASSMPKLSKKRQSRNDPEETSPAKVEIRVNIPNDLQRWLIDDWDAVNRQNRLLQIPAKTTVRDIITAYILQAKPSETANESKGTAMTDVIPSLIKYFDVMLGRQLLYDFERPQYAELLEQHPNTPMSEFYGSFHLLRMFVNVGSVMSSTTWEEGSVQMLLGHFQDFLMYLLKNSPTLFNMQQFVYVPAEYYRRLQDS